jgi:glutathione S-transferase
MDQGKQHFACFWASRCHAILPRPQIEGREMSEGRLYIGTRRYSSWSLRGWLPVKLAGLDVEEVVIPLAGGVTPAVREVSPGGTVPYLEHRGARIWESLAICEYCAEFKPDLWPADQRARAHARAISGEMHAGFRELRMAMPMSLFRPAAGAGHTEGALADIARIDALWSETRERFGEGGPYLFGASFGNVDAMYAPVVARFLTYQPKLSAAATQYCEAVRAHPLVSAWYDAAAREPKEWFIERYEAAAA